MSCNYARLRHYLRPNLDVWLSRSTEMHKLSHPCHSDAASSAMDQIRMKDGPFSWEVCGRPIEASTTHKVRHRFQMVLQQIIFASYCRLNRLVAQWLDPALQGLVNLFETSCTISTIIFAWILVRRDEKVNLFES